MAHTLSDSRPELQARVSAFGGRQAIAPEVERLRLPLSNAFFLGEPGQPWVLVDAGTPGSARLIMRAAQARYGAGTRPQAIVLTHGHLDHIGGLWGLLRHWPDVPVYAHSLELPYLTGKSAYPPPDPTVGGSMSALSPLFVPGPFDFRPQIRPLDELTLPSALSGWTFITTPGHSPGHVSLWREADRVLLAGDAFVTTVQERVTGALTLRPRLVHRPPAYYTPDWDQARTSVQRLAALEPALAVTGHGDPVGGHELRDELRRLAQNFDEVARPVQGRYATHSPTTTTSGVVSLPPLSPRGQILRAGLILVAGAAVFQQVRRWLS
ncbi:MAG: fold metallo-hydrolase [Deinococcus sp.]|nr:fold metallo-hydrolase [Deinococcus sp.]